MGDMGQLFKYSTEARLNVYSQESVIFSLEGIDILKDQTYFDDFHIYSILARPRYFFKKSSLKTDKAGINLEILDESGNSFCIIPDYKFKLVFYGIELDDLDYSFLSLSCELPFTRIDFTLLSSEALIEYLMKKVNICKSEDDIKKDILCFETSLDVEDILTDVHKRINVPYEMEVLYIGQAQGREAKRGAIERLQSHETLQKILRDCLTKFTNKRIFIMLFKFVEQQMMVFNGVDKAFLSAKDDDDRHHKQLVEDAIDITLNADRDKIRQVINITEAAMIKYFKPPYNNKFIDNFPSQKHQSYKHYYSLEYNSISIELALNQVVLFTKENEITNVWDFIEYELFPEDRASIYDIFCNLSRRAKS